MDETLLHGEQGRLLKKGVKIKTAIKKLEKELDTVKTKLDIKVKGKYFNSSDDTLTISEAETYTAVDPHILFKHMKKAKDLKNFWICVKVQLTTLKKYVPENTYNKWRKKGGNTQKWTWKVKN